MLVSIEPATDKMSHLMNVIDNEPKYALTTNIKTSKSDSFQATKSRDKRRPRATSFVCNMQKQS
jgi:hypothetical protein